jgi:large subunit ribosomal protein L35
MVLVQEKDMPKIKTRRATAKRFRVTGGGRIKCVKANRRHLLVGRTTKRKRQLRSPGSVPDVLEHFIRQQMPYA